MGPGGCRVGRGLRAVAEALADRAGGPWSRVLRARWVGPLEVRPLGAPDAAALSRFAARAFPEVSGFLVRQLTQRWGQAGAAAGAFDGQGRLLGFAYVDDYRQEGVALDGMWLRMLFVMPRARVLGVGRSLVRELCARAHQQGARCVRADVRADNGPSLRLFRGLGFEEGPAELGRALNAERAGSVEAGAWVVLERRLD